MESSKSSIAGLYKVVGIDGFAHEVLETTFRIHDIADLLVIHAPDNDFADGLVYDAASVVRKQTGRDVLILPVGIEFVRLERMEEP